MLDGGIGSPTRWERKGVLGLMRNGRREVLLLWLMLLLGAMARAAPFDSRRSGSGSDDRVGMTVELRWTTPGSEQHKNATRADGEATTELSLGTGEGGVSEVVAWPPEASADGAFGPRPGAGGSWQLGPGVAGRVRARLEVSLGAELIVRRGGNVVRIPVAAILERPQHTPAQSPLTVSVERLPWDSLMIELGQGAESGVVAPSTFVPLSVKYNILWSDAVDVSVRSTAVLRPMNGGEPLWRDEKRGVAASQPARSSGPDLDGPIAQG